MNYDDELKKQAVKILICRILWNYETVRQRKYDQIRKITY